MPLKYGLKYVQPVLPVAHFYLVSKLMIISKLLAFTFAQIISLSCAHMKYAVSSSVELQIGVIYRVK